MTEQMINDVIAVLLSQVKKLDEAFSEESNLKYKIDITKTTNDVANTIQKFYRSGFGKGRTA